MTFLKQSTGPLGCWGKRREGLPCEGSSVLSYLRLSLCVFQVREERLAEEKIKKRVAARKMEEAEARRRQEEEARRQRALQQVCMCEPVLSHRQSRTGDPPALGTGNLFPRCFPAM